MGEGPSNCNMLNGRVESVEESTSARDELVAMVQDPSTFKFK